MAGPQQARKSDSAPAGGTRPGAPKGGGLAKMPPGRTGLWFVLVLVAIALPLAFIPVAGVVVAYVLGYGLGLLVFPPLFAGGPLVALNLIQGKRWSFGDFFAGFNWFGGIVGTTFLQVILTLLCLAPAYIVLFGGMALGNRRLMATVGPLAFLGVEIGEAAAGHVVDLRRDVVGAQERQQLARRDGEVEARIGAFAFGAEAVDAEHAAALVEQRAARIAAGDRRGVQQCVELAARPAPGERIGSRPRKASSLRRSR